MSLLLDALNKADQERKRNSESPNISSNHDSAYPLARNRGRAVILLSLTVFLLIGLLIAVYWLGKQNHAAEPTAVSPERNLAAIQPANPPAAIAPAPQPGSIASEVPSQQAAPAAAETNDEENIASLYQQQTSEAVSIPNTPPSTPATETLPPPAPTVSAVPSTSPLSIAQFANLPDIQDLPNSVLARIPSLKYSEHNYNSNGGSVVINGLVKHANEQLSEGLVIDKILEDGIILHFETYSFKMRAMNNWVNM